MSIFRRDPAAPGANVGRPRLRGPVREDPLDAAVASFNGSEAARTMAGLAKSLGEPRVSVGAAAGSASEMRITVAWELCWYQWGVDLADEPHRVREIGSGEEVEELDRSARQWNASRGEHGALVLGAPVG